MSRSCPPGPPAPTPVESCTQRIVVLPFVSLISSRRRFACGQMVLVLAGLARNETRVRRAVIARIPRARAPARSSRRSTTRPREQQEGASTPARAGPAAARSGRATAPASFAVAGLVAHCVGGNGLLKRAPILKCPEHWYQLSRERVPTVQTIRTNWSRILYGRVHSGLLSAQNGEKCSKKSTIPVRFAGALGQQGTRALEAAAADPAARGGFAAAGVRFRSLSVRGGCSGTQQALSSHHQVWQKQARAKRSAAIIKYGRSKREPVDGLERALAARPPCRFATGPWQACEAHECSRLLARQSRRFGLQNRASARGPARQASAQLKDFGAAMAGEAHEQAV